MDKTLLFVFLIGNYIKQKKLCENQTIYLSKI